MILKKNILGHLFKKGGSSEKLYIIAEVDPFSFFERGRPFFLRGRWSASAQRIGERRILTLKMLRKKHKKSNKETNKMYLKQKPNPQNAYM